MKHINFAYISLLVFLILGVSLIPSCVKDKTPCTTCPTGNTNCEDIQNVKKFFAFKLGSWWVYEEETSGARDSVYVTSYQNNPTNYDFDVRVYSTYQDYYYHYWPEFAGGVNSCSESGDICQRCITVMRSKYKTGDFVDEAKCFPFISKKGESFSNFNTAYSNNKLIINDVVDSFNLDLLLFGRTFVIHELNTYMEGTQPTNHFFSENVGLIRKELLDSNQVWNLVNYHIQE